MKLSLAILSLAATASAFTSISTPARSVSRTVASSDVFAPVSVRSSGSQLEAAKQTPHGGALVDLILKSDEEKDAAIAACTKELQLSPRQLCDVELLMNGGFSPLTGFMNEETYKNVVDNVELPGGLIFGDGKIVCDNTMSSRLNLVYSELLPAIRALLFPEEQ